MIIYSNQIFSASVSTVGASIIKGSTYSSLSYSYPSNVLVYC